MATWHLLIGAYPFATSSNLHRLKSIRRPRSTRPDGHRCFRRSFAGRFAPLHYEACGDGRLIPEDAGRRGGSDGVVVEVASFLLLLGSLVDVRGGGGELLSMMDLSICCTRGYGELSGRSARSRRSEGEGCEGQCTQGLTGIRRGRRRQWQHGGVSCVQPGGDRLGIFGAKHGRVLEVYIGGSTWRTRKKSQQNRRGFPLGFV